MLSICLDVPISGTAHNLEESRAVAEKIGPRRRQGWFGPSVDLTVHLLDACRSDWVFAHNRARHAGDGYASVDMALWDLGPDGGAAGRLVAYATQLCFFTFVD